MRETKWISISNLSPKHSLSVIVKIFGFFGNVKSSFMYCKNLAFLEYSSEEEALAARVYDGIRSYDRFLRVEIAKDLPCKPSDHAAVATAVKLGRQRAQELLVGFMNPETKTQSGPDRSARSVNPLKRKSGPENSTHGPERSANPRVRYAANPRVRYAPEDPNLPEPWIGLVDIETDYLYFWNPKTNKTQYERPASSAPPKLSATTVSSSAQTQQSSSGVNRGCSPGKEEAKYGKGRYAANPRVRYAPEDPNLPEPWIGLVDIETDYLYFWNPKTNKTQYERPASSAPPKLSATTVRSSAQTQQSSSGVNRGCSPGKEEAKYGKGSDGPKSGSGSRFTEAARTGPMYSKDAASGLGNGASGGSSVRGPPSSAAGNETSPEDYCRLHEITVFGGQVPPPLLSFEANHLPPKLLQEVYKAGFSAPSPIQAQSWPIAMQNRDIVAIAKTGSGKTLGYLVPCFMHLLQNRKDLLKGPTILVLSPTEELATQIQAEALKFGESSKISCACLDGRAPDNLLEAIERGVDIIVATPGGLNDILERRTISLNHISHLVLDEADRMVNIRFEPQIRKIVKEVPTKRQTLMYTATWPKEARKIAADLLVNPVRVNIGNVDELVPNKSITQA